MTIVALLKDFVQIPSESAFVGIILGLGLGVDVFEDRVEVIRRLDFFRILGRRVFEVGDCSLPVEIGSNRI